MDWQHFWKKLFQNFFFFRFSIWSILVRSILISLAFKILAKRSICWLNIFHSSHITSLTRWLMKKRPQNILRIIKAKIANRKLVLFKFKVPYKLWKKFIFDSHHALSQRVGLVFETGNEIKLKINILIRLLDISFLLINQRKKAF